VERDRPWSVEDRDQRHAPERGEVVDDAPYQSLDLLIGSDGRRGAALGAIERALSLLHPEEFVANEARELFAALAPVGEGT
jgi:hypothetical protein